MKKINPITNTLYANAIVFSMQKTMRPVLFQFLNELGANIPMKEKIIVDPLDLSTVIGLFGRISKDKDSLDCYHQYEHCLRYTAAVLLKRFRTQGHEVFVHGYDFLFDHETYYLSKRSDLERLVKDVKLVA